MRERDTGFFHPVQGGLEPGQDLFKNYHRLSQNLPDSDRLFVLAAGLSRGSFFTGKIRIKNPDHFAMLIHPLRQGRPAGVFRFIFLILRINQRYFAPVFTLRLLQHKRGQAFPVGVGNFYPALFHSEQIHQLSAADPGESPLCFLGPAADHQPQITQLLSPRERQIRAGVIDNAVDIHALINGDDPKALKSFFS